MYIRKYLIFILLALCIVSCINFWKAKHVSRPLSKEYTRLDSLLRLDGYYYHEDRGQVVTPFRISNNGEFFIVFARLSGGHDLAQEWFKRNSFFYRGHYVLSNDTIKVRWASRFDLMSYNIHSWQFVIKNDTTLQLIWRLCETCHKYDGRKEHDDPMRDEIYRFFQYDFNTR